MHLNPSKLDEPLNDDTMGLSKEDKMKKIVFGMIVLVTILGAAWLMNQNNDTEELVFAETYSYDISDDINQIETITENRPVLAFYLNELRDTHINIEALRDDIALIVTDLQEVKALYDDGSLTLNETDRFNIAQSMKRIRLDQYMIQHTSGDVYQQLIFIKDHRDTLSDEEIKDILIDVYQTLNARQQMLENIYDELINIQNIVSNN